MFIQRSCQSITVSIKHHSSVTKIKALGWQNSFSPKNREAMFESLHSRRVIQPGSCAHQQLNNNNSSSTVLTGHAYQLTIHFFLKGEVGLSTGLDHLVWVR